ncbi:hypothetical protein IPM62_02645 [Candidatus Woesebacteria bacterium]|nr:MAG: hypothetical protein IPM62_02645 [Candidatus Woesebacteria bacterium]
MTYNVIILVLNLSFSSANSKMNIAKSISLSLVSLLLSLSLTSSVSAQSAIPNFPACSNPQGVLKVSYTDGQHAIVGEGVLRAGSDYVYSLENGSAMQCFCSENGSGVQTNWWKISSLDEDEIETLKKLGWVFVPSGSVWGLDASSYMAINANYSCGGSTNSSSTSSNSNTSTGSVLSAAASTSNGGSVLGLATTGNLATITIYTLLGFSSLLAGVILKKTVAR